jgi:hypothetical protein
VPFLSVYTPDSSLASDISCDALCLRQLLWREFYLEYS